jgi:hypothetical protein
MDSAFPRKFIPRGFENIANTCFMEALNWILVSHRKSTLTYTELTGCTQYTNSRFYNLIKSHPDCKRESCMLCLVRKNAVNYVALDPKIPFYRCNAFFRKMRAISYTDPDHTEHNPCSQEDSHEYLDLFLQRYDDRLKKFTEDLEFKLGVLESCDLRKSPEGKMIQDQLDITNQ